MAQLSDLQQTVSATLASKRLGQPVFVRYLLQSSAETATLLPRLTQLAHACSGWLAQNLASVYLVGSLDKGHLSATLLYQGGASAQLSVVQTKADNSVDLMVVGNRGVLYHELAPLFLGVETDTLPAPPAQLLAFFERALQSGLVETVRVEGQP